MWIVAVSILLSLNDYGAFLVLILISPFIAMSNYGWLWLPNVTGSIANLVGVKPNYVWAGLVALGTGILFTWLALKEPSNRLYKHAAILLLGLLVTAAISIKRFTGWAGV